MSIELHECYISKRGKGANGVVQAKTLGVPMSSDDDKDVATKAWDYDHLNSIATSELLEFVSKSGYNVNRVLALGFDALQKSASIRAQNAKSELRVILIAKGLATEKNAESKAQAVINAANLTDSTHEEVIEAMLAKIAKKQAANQEMEETEDE